MQADGTFSSLVLLPSGFELLDSGTVGGNQLAAMDSTGLAPSDHNLHVRERYQRPGSGPELDWAPSNDPQLGKSLLGLNFSLTGHMGPSISATLLISFYNELPRIDFSWRCEFADASIGSFYNDNTKLRVHWPVSFSGDIYRDIAFGVISSREERPFSLPIGSMFQMAYTV